MRNLLLALTLALCLLSQDSFGMPTSSAVSLEIQQMLGATAAAPAASLGVRSLRDQVFESWEIECFSRRRQDVMDCSIESARSLCRKRSKEFKMGEAECLIWGDLFVSLNTHRASLLETGDLYHARRMAVRERLEFLKQRVQAHSLTLERIFELGALPCKFPFEKACEAERLERFCLSYGVVSRMPVAACITGVLYGKWVSVTR